MENFPEASRELILKDYEEILAGGKRIQGNSYQIACYVQETMKFGRDDSISIQSSGGTVPKFI